MASRIGQPRRSSGAQVAREDYVVAATAQLTKIYVYLLNEGVDVWRPVDAEKVENDLYRLVGSPPDETEHWEFPTGSVVRAEIRSLSEGPTLVAVELIAG